MIIDKIENHSLYYSSPVWNQAFSFLSELNSDTPEGKYEIDGKNMFAGVDVYETKDLSRAVVESHRKYIDIQVLLSGKEQLNYSPIQSLSIVEPYNEGNDVVFYDINKKAKGSFELSPGSFMVFFPQDGHSPGLAIGGESQTVKKVVIKIALDIFI